MTMWRTTGPILTTVTALGLVLVCNSEAMADKCEVTAGANKGKTGTFTEGGTWCEGSWGGTECTDQQGNSKCKAAALVTGDGTAVFDGNNGLVIVTNGLYQTSDKGLVRCTTSTTARSTAVCLPVIADNLEQLRNSKDNTDKSIGDAVKTAISPLPNVKQ
jgi:hypothetical protein